MSSSLEVRGVLIAAILFSGGALVANPEEPAIRRVSDYIGYNRISSTNRGKKEFTETYVPRQARHESPNVSLSEIRDGKRVKLPAFWISDYADRMKRGNELGHLPCLSSFSLVPGIKDSVMFEANTLSFSKDFGSRFQKSLQFNFFEYAGLGQTVVRGRNPMIVDFAQTLHYAIGTKEFDFDDKRVAEASRVAKTRRKADGTPATVEFRHFVLIGPVPAKLPAEVFEGKPLSFRKLSQVSIHAELPLGINLPGTPLDPEIAWTAEAVEGGEYFKVSIEDPDAPQTLLPAKQSVTRKSKSEIIQIGFEATKEIPPSQVLKARVSAIWIAKQPSSQTRIEEPLGSFETILQKSAD